MNKEIKVVELFAGVGGFRIGLEGASDCYKTIWNNCGNHPHNTKTLP